MGHWHEENGATAVEYGLIAGALGVVFVVAGPMLQDAFAFLLNVVLCDILGGGATCA